MFRAAELVGRDRDDAPLELGPVEQAGRIRLLPPQPRQKRRGLEQPWVGRPPRFPARQKYGCCETQRCGRDPAAPNRTEIDLYLRAPLRRRITGDCRICLSSGPDARNSRDSTARAGNWERRHEKTVRRNERAVFGQQLHTGRKGMQAQRALAGSARTHEEHPASAASDASPVQGHQRLRARRHVRSASSTSS